MPDYTNSQTALVTTTILILGANGHIARLATDYSRSEHSLTHLNAVRHREKEVPVAPPQVMSTARRNRKPEVHHKQRVVSPNTGRAQVATSRCTIRNIFVDAYSLSPELRERTALSRRYVDIVIHQKASDVLPFVDTVRTNADRERDALGFLPGQAYEQAARAGNLFVVADSNDDTPQYIGHLLFGASFPHIRIYQIYVLPKLRNCGAARQLVDALVRFGEEREYLSISARVADDLAANAFWDKLAFETRRQEPGGTARKRSINIRVRQLNTPNLFGYREPVSGLPVTKSLGRYTPVYAIDLNVFFDVVRRRPRAEYAATVISAGLDSLLRIAVTEEFANELKRSSTSSGGDPILEFALQLPTMPTPEPRVRDALVRQLADIVFPERAKRGSLTIQDTSDLVHLATAAYHTATGFVTAENALVVAADEIQARFGIRVLHVKQFAEVLKHEAGRTHTVDVRFGGDTIRVSELSAALRPGVVRLLDQIETPDDLRELVVSHGVRSAGRRSLVVSQDERVLCAAFWESTRSLQGVLRASILADEDHPAIETALDSLMYRLSRDATSRHPSLVELIVPRAYVVTQQVASRYGYTKTDELPLSSTNRWQRLAIGMPITPERWPSVRENLRQLGLSFPAELPSFKLYDFQLPFEGTGGKQFVINIGDLETALSPAVFVIPGRTAVLVPIRAGYAGQLLGTSSQLSLLPVSGAALFHERAYFSAARNARLLREGAAVVFYESSGQKGRSAAIAIGRVLYTVVSRKGEIAATRLRHGVLEAQQIETITAHKKVAVTTFDNVIPFRCPVPLKHLRSIGCIDAANLVSARLIDSPQLDAIVREGMEWPKHTS